MIDRIVALALTAWLLSVGAVLGHALEPGFLSLKQLSDTSWQVVMRKPDVQGRPMDIAATLPVTCKAPFSPVPVYDGSAWISSWVADCAAPIVGDTITIDGLVAQRTDVLARVEYRDGRFDTIRLTPDAPSFVLTAAPTAWGVLSNYLALGFEHILEGWDHLLFVFALLLLIRDTWRLIGAITAFTIAHSITLGLAALGYVSLPGPPVEAIIALSIVFLAIEVLKRDPKAPRLSERAPWVVSFGFGLLHGMGFAGALTEIGLPATDIPLALLGFNLGVELGQISFVIAVIAVLAVLRRVVTQFVQTGDTLSAQAFALTTYAVGGVATFWLVERISGF
ncbi:HupE/UreJ family protein [uncultured Shimia sp.]|uniref:HupE/UreJ family protein n=1 Tax=uncultured Shimia sp. TaxID=573152 RepID=UPI002609FAD7|nr:HupE/UreJ family protein [uncultured Shimia sp.]